MKLLILACLLGISAASFLQEAAPAIDNAVMSFWYGASKAGSLSDALGTNDPIIAQIEDDAKTELGKMLKDTFNKLLEKIKEHVDHGKTVGTELVEKAKEIAEKLKEFKIDVGNKAKELYEKVKDRISSALRDIFGKLFGKEKRSLNDEYDNVARMRFRDIIEKIKEKILSNETIQKIKNYIKNIISDNPLVNKLKELMQKLRDVDLREILGHLLEYSPGRQQRSIWETIKEKLNNMKITINEKLKKAGEWLKDMWSKGLENAKDKHALVKAIVLEFIARTKDTSADVAREMLEFLEPYKDDMGALWQQFIDAVKEAIGKF